MAGTRESHILDGTGAAGPRGVLSHTGLAGGLDHTPVSPAPHAWATKDKRGLNPQTHYRDNGKQWIIGGRFGFILIPSP